MATDPAIETIDEFRGEYELELENWLHRRFRRFCGTLFAIELISLALWVLNLAIARNSWTLCRLGQQLEHRQKQG